MADPAGNGAAGGRASAEVHQGRHFGDLATPEQLDAFEQEFGVRLPPDTTKRQLGGEWRARAREDV